MKAGQGQNALIPEMFEKRAALFVLEFSGRALPLEKLADGFGQLGKTEVGEIMGSLTDEFELGRGKIPAGKGNPRFRHACSPLLLVFLPYPKAKTMSRTKCDQAKIFQEPGAEAALDDSDCRYPSEKLCRQPANQVSRGRADQAAKNNGYALCQH
jgi:hypothetical protein